ncbi:MAG: cytochrome c biogenesis protein ResB [Phocaeicola sp.]
MAYYRKKIWQNPWGYTESLITISALIAVGIALQIAIGEFDFYLLAYPVNVVAIILLALLSLSVGLSVKKSAFAKWICGVPMCVTLLSSFALLTLIMGLTLQTNGQSNTLLGFDTMTRNWAFIIIYILILVSLGALIVHRLKRFSWSDWSFFANHIGLWLLLAASGLGYADMERYIMHIREGETEWRVYDEQGEIKELPIAITLNDFDMDYYPPKLAIINKVTGEIMPKGKPQFFQIDKDFKRGSINGWQIEIEEYIHQAMRSSDSTYREVPMPGSTPAVKLKISKEGVTRSGWVCGGNQAQLFMTLSLDDHSSLVMTVADPRLFLSDIEVYTQDEKQQKKVIEVNKPLRINSWTIYQYGYDNNAGRLSSYSSLELIYDPWIIPVYIGIVLMMIGSAAMIWQGKRRKEELYDLE